MKAKDTSHIGMIIGAVCLLLIFSVTIYKLITCETFVISVDNALALILIGLSPSVPFSPIFISKWLDKLIELKKGNDFPPR